MMMHKKVLVLLLSVPLVHAGSFPLKSAAAATACALVGAAWWQSMMLGNPAHEDERAAAIRILGGWSPSISFQADLMARDPIYGGSSLVRNQHVKGIPARFVRADFDYWHSVDPDLAQRPVAKVHVCGKRWPFSDKSECVDVPCIESRADVSKLLEEAGVQPSRTYRSAEGKIESWKTRETPEEHYSSMLMGKVTPIVETQND